MDTTIQDCVCCENESDCINGLCLSCRLYNDELQKQSDLLTLGLLQGKNKISTLKAALEVHRWIPVAERLPDSSKQVLAFNLHTGDHAVAKHTRDNFWINPVTGVWLFHVTHWKPIQLPKESGG